MANIELPRPLEAYFAFAELPASERGRHFTITFTYMEGARLDRLQWWWQINKGQERSAGETLLQSSRQEAILRFKQHIERWLVNSQRRLTGGDPFPMLEAQPAVVPALTSETESARETGYIESVRTYARIAAGG